MSKKLILFPFGGNAREALVAIQAVNKIIKEWEVLGFVDDDVSKKDMECLGVKVLGASDVLNNQKDVYLLALPGNPNTFLKRKEVIDALSSKSNRFAQIVHPSVNIPVDSKIGVNTVIMANVVIGCNVNIGNHCVILPNTTISHDSKINDYCCVGSNVVISGNVNIEESCYVGSGSNIKDNINIGAESLIGLGSNVISNVEEGTVVAGNPAKFLRKSES